MIGKNKEDKLMETIGEILRNISPGSHSQKQGKHTTTGVLTTGEMNTIPAYLTPEEITKYEFVTESEPPEPEECNFCHKKLYHLGVRSLFTRSVIAWKQEPERCNCTEAVELWKRIDKMKAKADAERLQKLEQEERTRKARILFDKSKMGARFQTRTFDTFKVDEHNAKVTEAVKRYSDSFETYAKQGVGFMLSGPYGCGKTHLAAALAIDLINRGTSVIFGTLINLLGKIKQTYNSDQNDEFAILETYSTVDLLIIDDLGKERVSEWMLEKLFSIVNTRYENNLPIVVTTNYNVETLIEKLSSGKNRDIGESIVSRLHEICRGMHINAPDHRRVSE